MMVVSPCSCLRIDPSTGFAFLYTMEDSYFPKSHFAKPELFCQITASNAKTNVPVNRISLSKLPTMAKMHRCVFLLVICVAVACNAGILKAGFHLIKSRFDESSEPPSNIDVLESEEDSCAAIDEINTDDNNVHESSYQASYPAVQTQDETLGADFGEAQVVDSKHEASILERIQEARAYLHDEVLVDPKYRDVRDFCRNKHADCAFWSVIGECEKNPAYMKINCAPVCKSCDQLNIETRCPMDADAVDALYPGDLNKMFECIVTDPAFKKYEPVVLSRPDYAPGDTADNATYSIGIWMVMFENAISDAEANRIIELGGIQGYHRSADVGVKQADGTYSDSVNEGRTSTNAVGSASTDSVVSRYIGSHHLPSSQHSGAPTSATKIQLRNGSCCASSPSLAFQRQTLRISSCCATRRISSTKSIPTIFRIKEIVQREFES